MSLQLKTWPWCWGWRLRGEKLISQVVSAIFILYPWVRCCHACKVAGIKVYPRRNQNNRPHAVTACISLWCYGVIKWLLHVLTACISLWCHRAITWLLHALTAWDLKFQVCLRYTFILATLPCLCLPQSSRPREEYSQNALQIILERVCLNGVNSHIM